jgi:hypothetical protein
MLAREHRTGRSGARGLKVLLDVGTDYAAAMEYALFAAGLSTACIDACACIGAAGARVQRA